MHAEAYTVHTYVHMLLEVGVSPFVRINTHVCTHDSNANIKRVTERVYVGTST